MPVYSPVLAVNGLGRDKGEGEMTVAELIEALKDHPDQQTRVVFTYASEIDGDTVVAEVGGICVRSVCAAHSVLSDYGTPTIDVVELV
jgi:hypothetical protein